MQSIKSIVILSVASTALAAAVPAVMEKRGTQCINFESSLDWYYTLQNPWGTGSGQGGSQICVPTSSSAGGAMFIGPDANPGAGSTKLECFFPGSGQANCDVSLVDGYSLSVACTATGNSNTIGGSVDLYSTGTACPDQSGPNCLNSNGGDAGSQADINAFFQPGVVNGNNYCIWENCGQDYYFDSSATITCTISGTAE